MNRISKFFEILTWIIVFLGLFGLGASAYVIASFWMIQNDGRQTVQPVRPVGVISDGSSDRSTLGGQQ
ncbi:hypothetical protein A6S26_05480 [Nostoc sp. ATCC 43529]|nr:hypothetical protein A6S26_05480 [Nostoc sp. ATCC 43529]